MTEPTWSLSLCLCAVHTLHNCFSSTQQLGASCDSYALIPFYSPLHLLNPTIWASSLLLEPDRHTPTSGPVSTTPTSLSRLYIRFTPSPASGLCSNATFTVMSSQTPYLKLCSVLISSLLFIPLFLKNVFQNIFYLRYFYAFDCTFHLKDMLPEGRNICILFLLLLIAFPQDLEFHLLHSNHSNPISYIERGFLVWRIY